MSSQSRASLNWSLVVLASFLLQVVPAQGQNFVWAKQMGGVSVDRAWGAAVDGSGNVYTTGGFNGTADFDPGSGAFNLTSAGSLDIFVSKLDSAGNFVWAKQMGGSRVDIAEGVALDGSGNVHTTGFFGGTADFDPGSGAFNLTAAGRDDIFVSKLDSAGNFVWAEQMGGQNSDQAKGVAVDCRGNVYTTGWFDGTADFDPGPGVFNLFGTEQDIFVSKLDSRGNFVWAVATMGGFYGVQHQVAVDVDGSGNVYTTGSFTESLDFDPGPNAFILTPAGGSDIFVSKLEPNGPGPPPGIGPPPGAGPPPGVGPPPCPGP